MEFFTADFHFGHANIIKFCKRPFKDADEMDKVLIDNWNRVVQKDDTVYVLGDFTFRSSHPIRWYREQLNGHIVLVQGNHDDMRVIRRANPPLFQEIVPGYMTITRTLTVGGKRTDVPITLCHYAMRQWPYSHHGSWHLFGHSHGNTPPYGKSFDVGVDCHDYTPLSLTEVAEKMAALTTNVDLVR